jgi:hypothetical protein
MTFSPAETSDVTESSDRVQQVSAGNAGRVGVGVTPAHLRST